jgi:hypothetical protein
MLARPPRLDYTFTSEQVTSFRRSPGNLLGVLLHDGPKSRLLIQRESDRLGIPWDAIQRAAAALDVVEFKSDWAADPMTYWRLGVPTRKEGRK